jgi:hypothetical protein
MLTWESNVYIYTQGKNLSIINQAHVNSVLVNPPSMENPKNHLEKIKNLSR